MMKVRAATKFLPRYARSIGFSVVLVLSAVSAPAQEYERDAVLRFNLVCAHCHEAECSGRLSFTSGPKATFDHIRRFAGEVAPATALQLNAVLAYMKQHCAYAPIAAIDSVARVRKDILDGYRDASTGGYFLPLGHLEGKRYRIALNFSHPTAAHLEVLNEFFSLVLDESAEFNENALSWEFGVEEPASHFLRVRVDSGLTLDELRLTTAE
jgi:hypothetical protein